MNKAKKKAVFVGLPSEKIGQQIYGNKKNPQTIMTVGAIHEYGAGNNPKRSYLRTPFIMHKSKINEFIAQQFEKSLDGQAIEKGLGLVGAFCRNISVKSFTTAGYGTWQDIEPETKKRKGSSRILIDSGTLRNSITWVVRND